MYQSVLPLGLVRVLHPLYTHIKRFIWRFLVTSGFSRQCLDRGFHFMGSVTPQQQQHQCYPYSYIVSHPLIIIWQFVSHTKKCIKLASAIPQQSYGYQFEHQKHRYPFMRPTAIYPHHGVSWDIFYKENRANEPIRFINQLRDKWHILNMIITWNMTLQNMYAHFL